MYRISQNIIKHKVGLLNLATELGNISRACKVMGFSRDTFYRYQTAVFLFPHLAYEPFGYGITSKFFQHSLRHPALTIPTSPAMP